LLIKSLVLLIYREDYLHSNLTNIKLLKHENYNCNDFLASLFAIAGATLFQLFVLLTSTLFARQAYDRQNSGQALIP
jgi:hypothetical protein